MISQDRSSSIIKATIPSQILVEYLGASLIFTLAKRFPFGIFFSPGKVDQDGKLVYNPMGHPATSVDQKVQDRFCSPGNLATTSHFSGRIFFCPPAFGTSPTIAGEAGNIQTFTLLDTLFSGSRLIIHEFVHLWNPSKTHYDELAKSSG